MFFISPLFKPKVIPRLARQGVLAPPAPAGEQSLMHTVNHTHALMQMLRPPWLRRPKAHHLLASCCVRAVAIS